jgi:hypothetical protein
MLNKLRLLYALLACFVVLGLSGCLNDRPVLVSQYFRADIIFSEPLSVQEVEQRGLDDVRKSAVDDRNIPQVPFGFMNKEWVEMKSKIKPGDRLVAFNTPKEYWDNLAGMKGYALIRGEILVDVLITVVN